MGSLTFTQPQIWTNVPVLCSSEQTSEMSLALPRQTVVSSCVVSSLFGTWLPVKTEAPCHLSRIGRVASVQGSKWAKSFLALEGDLRHVQCGDQVSCFLS